MMVLPPRMQEKLYHELLLPEETREINRACRIRYDNGIAPTMIERRSKWMFY
jgi:hypothetical protein